MDRILINATHQNEELRVAVVNNGKTLTHLDIQHPGLERKKANIYKGTVTRVEHSLEAAFVSYGAERHGFLPLKEVAPEYYGGGASDDDSEEGGDTGQGHQRPQKRAGKLREGQTILIQVEKEERGNKGAALSTYISLAGCYLVLMPNNPKAGGISRRVEGDDRGELRDIMNQLVIPDSMGVIIRTAGVGKHLEELQWDLDVLVQRWHAIQVASDASETSTLIYEESDVVNRTLRDYLRPDITEILVDDLNTFEKTKHHVSQIRPDYVDRIKHYDDKIPLFSRYQIERQIEEAHQRTVRLPSGGSVVIEATEALVSIDINSAKATRGGDIEETALQTNLEAAEEIARQLRLRDLGGLIVIDFIDMRPVRNQRDVENRLQEACKKDRARIQMRRISRFGLLEMSRQRLRSSLGDNTQNVCPRCHGTGAMRSVESLALSILRLLEEDAVRDTGIARLVAQVPVAVATFLLNEKRQAIEAIETSHRINIVIIPNRHMETPDFTIDKTRGEKVDSVGLIASYEQVSTPDKTDDSVLSSTNEYRQKERPVAAVAQMAIAAPPPPQPRKKPGLLKRLWLALFGNRQRKPHHKPRHGQGGNRHHNSRRHPQQRRHQANRNDRDHDSNDRDTNDRNHNNRNRNRNDRNRNSNDRNRNNRNRNARNRDDNDRNGNDRNRNNNDRNRNDDDDRSGGNGSGGNSNSGGNRQSSGNRQRSGGSNRNARYNNNNNNNRQRPSENKASSPQSAPEKPNDYAIDQTQGNVVVIPPTDKTSVVDQPVDGNKE